jgi:hypothetical protein
LARQTLSPPKRSVHLCIEVAPLLINVATRGSSIIEYRSLGLNAQMEGSSWIRYPRSSVGERDWIEFAMQTPLAPRRVRRQVPRARHRHRHQHQHIWVPLARDQQWHQHRRRLRHLRHLRHLHQPINLATVPTIRLTASIQLPSIKTRLLISDSSPIPWMFRTVTRTSPCVLSFHRASSVLAWHD